MMILRKMIDTLTYAFYIVSNCGISLKMNVRVLKTKAGETDVRARCARDYHHESLHPS